MEGKEEEGEEKKTKGEERVTSMENKMEERRCAGRYLSFKKGRVQRCHCILEQFDFC